MTSPRGDSFVMASEASFPVNAVAEPRRVRRPWEVCGVREGAWIGDEPAYLVRYREEVERHRADPVSVYRDGTYGSIVLEYAHAVPNAEALGALVQLSPIVEIGAGNGYWARLLQDLGADVIAVDRDPPGSREGWYARSTPWTEITRGSCDAVQVYPDRTLFISWPNRPDGFVSDCLELYEGRCFVLISVGRVWPDIDERLFRLLDSRWALAREIEIPRWHGKSDRMMLWERQQ